MLLHLGLHFSKVIKFTGLTCVSGHMKNFSHYLSSFK